MYAKVYPTYIMYRSSSHKKYHFKKSSKEQKLGIYRNISKAAGGLLHPIQQKVVLVIMTCYICMHSTL